MTVPTDTRSGRTRRRAVLAALALVAGLAACGDDRDMPAATVPATRSTTTAGAGAGTTASSIVSSAASTTPATVASTTASTASTGSTVAAETTASAGSAASTAAAAPARIVSLSPSATETLFAIGAGSQVLAVDQYSNFPAETQTIRHDLDGFEPNVETIAALHPDLVIHDGTRDLHAQLSKLGIRDLAAPAPADLDGVYSQIEQLGAATGHVADAAQVVARMTATIQSAVASARSSRAGTRYFHEVDKTLYTVTSTSFIGQLYALFGLVNIADASGGSNPYPQLSAETVIQADPQLIFLADGDFGESAATVATRPGWDSIAAVKAGNIVVLDADIASRWGPRVADLVTAIAGSLAKVAAPTG